MTKFLKSILHFFFRTTHLPGVVEEEEEDQSIRQHHRRQSWGLGMSRPPQILDWGVVGVAGVVGEDRGRIAKHYYILSCT